MTTIYLIRHGQTDWNKNKIFRGRADVPLNEHGRKEAEALARYLKDVRPTACYSSPLSRARETAEIAIRPRSLAIASDEGIIDIDYGKWQGVSDADVRKHYSETHRRWHETPQRVKFPGGESLAMVRRRAMASLDRIRMDNPEGIVYVVAHRVLTKVMMCAVLGLGNVAFWKIRQDNCAYNIIEFSDKGAVVVVMNETCHMRAAGLAPKLGDF